MYMMRTLVDRACVDALDARANVAGVDRTVAT
jgi:hypothetical protein